MHGVADGHAAAPSRRAGAVEVRLVAHDAGVRKQVYPVAEHAERLDHAVAPGHLGMQPEASIGF
eukprot:scaffold574_cov246-Pinguiococcus_pyrenoidosus.AAC.3